MTSEWPKRFRQFSLAVHVIEDDVFENIESAVDEYFTEVVRCHYFRILVDGGWGESDEGDAIPVLTTIWSSDPEKKVSTVPVRSPAKTRHQIVYSYATRQPLWVINAEGSVLAGTPDATTDRWSGATGLPKYRKVGDRLTKTSIVVPLEYGDRTFGVMNLEFDKHIPISQKAKDNAQMIADALGRIIWIWKTTETQLEGTRHALTELSSSSGSEASPIERRTVFISSSDEADEAVTKAILGVLAEFGHIFTPVFWKKTRASGSINEQVRAGIAGCDFGICYFSEPATDSTEQERSYVDNPNVLFEAGMMQMLHELTDSRGALVSRWIPIREEQADAPPFNFAGERIIMVPRVSDTGELDEEEFKAIFRSAVIELVEQLDLD